MLNCSRSITIFSDMRLNLADTRLSNLPSKRLFRLQWPNWLYGSVPSRQQRFPLPTLRTSGGPSFRACVLVAVAFCSVGPLIILIFIIITYGHPHVHVLVVASDFNVVLDCQMQWAQDLTTIMPTSSSQPVTSNHQPSPAIPNTPLRMPRSNYSPFFPPLQSHSLDIPHLFYRRCILSILQ